MKEERRKRIKVGQLVCCVSLGVCVCVYFKWVSVMLTWNDIGGNGAEGKCYNCLYWISVCVHVCVLSKYVAEHCCRCFTAFVILCRCVLSCLPFFQL